MDDKQIGDAVKLAEKAFAAINKWSNKMSEGGGHMAASGVHAFCGLLMSVCMNKYAGEPYEEGIEQIEMIYKKLLDELKC